ncbi:MAG: aldo/keto reductase [Deltaproteobacteria bacterium RIFOXYD12_FULL_55_16]|nr:MAG: aldo/keto reductase [Deltaproteobacteria bacterium RIFOXYD12_FULL_55_16]
MRLALGTVQFGLDYGIANQEGQVTRSAAKAMLQLAAENGLDMLDTAIAYGESETCLGEVGTQGFKLVTKLPAVPDNCADVSGWVKEQVAASLSRLGVDAVYGLLLHRPEQLLGTEGKTLYKTLQGLKETGQVQMIGVSIYSPGELAALTPQFRFDLVQAPFNLLDRRLHVSGWLQRLKSEGVEIHARSAFLQGLLLMPQGLLPDKFSPWADLWSKWQDWLAHHTVSAVQACLMFPLSFPEIDRVVVGADSVNQLKQIITAATSVASVDFPDLHCEAENLINPARWPFL